MKQIFKSIAAFALVATLSASCSKDEATTTPTETVIGAPTLTVVTPTAELNLRINEVVSINFIAAPASGAKLKSIIISKKGGNNDTSSIVFYNSDSTVSIVDSSSINRTVKDSVFGNVGDKITYTITVTDNKAKSISKTFSLNIKDLYLTGQFTIGAEASTTTEIRCFGLQSGIPKSIFLLKDGIATPPKTYPSTADSATRARFNSQKVDFVYFFSSGADGNAIYSPDYTFTAGHFWNKEISFWGTKNATVFANGSIDKSVFAATNFNMEQTIDAVNFATGTTKFVRNLQAEKAYAFKTASGAKGYILVNVTAPDNKGYATFEIKWKK